MNPWLTVLVVFFILLIFFHPFFIIAFKLNYVYKIRIRWLNEDYELKKQYGYLDPRYNLVPMRVDLISYDTMLYRQLYRFKWPEYELKKEWDS